MMKGSNPLFRTINIEEVKLKPGWLLKDVKRAFKRMKKWQSRRGKDERNH